MEQQVLPLPLPRFAASRPLPRHLFPLPLRWYSHSPNSPLYFHCSSVYVADCRDANAVLTIGQETVMAKTDGSLQIQIPDSNSPGGKLLWNRQYYVIALEVLPESPPVQFPPSLPRTSPATFCLATAFPLPSPTGSSVCFLRTLTLGKTLLPRRERKRSGRRNNRS
jgi:hypothetical protein